MSKVKCPNCDGMMERKSTMCRSCWDEMRRNRSDFYKKIEQKESRFKQFLEDMTNFLVNQ